MYLEEVMEEKYMDVIETIEKQKKLDDDLEKKLREAVEEYKGLLD